MVGLGDIPCVGKFVERVSEYSVDAVFRGLRYMLCYKALVNDLNSEFEKLNIEKENMAREVKKEEKNGKIIKDYVLKWQKDVEEIEKSGEELSPSCSCIQRFRIGRNAVKKAETVTQLTSSGKEHLAREIAYLPEVIYMPNPDSTFEEFQSRKDIYKKLWDALVDEDSPLIHGIYGMAGVGKTRMMEQFWEEALKKKIFNKAIRVNVGNENTDKVKLQGQVADGLGCELVSQVVESRASQLENSLRNGGKILLILDDIWTKIPLKDIIGTPFSTSSKGSKILLTSRKKEVCLNNECKHVVEIKTLSPDEALLMFKKTVGPADSNNPLPDESLVKEVCDKCGELPLLIHAVGKALKGKPQDLWNDAHEQLRKGKFEEIADVDRQVYTGIKLSIDYLQYDDAKSCLFLCSMFPEDANIDMKMLVHLASGSQLIPGGESRVLAMVDHLERSSLLLKHSKIYHNEIKVHDIIRDVARSIAFTDSKYAFLQVTCNSRYVPFDTNYCTRKFLRLDVDTANVHYSENLVCPDLHTLWLQSNRPQQFSGGFFRMFVNLNFLMLQDVKIYLEHFSFQSLDNLGTLKLSDCDISKIDVRLFPKSLKNLWICDCLLPIPLDLGNLESLQKLEIQLFQHWPTHSSPVAKLVMVSNVMSKLQSLEELHIPNGFVIDHEEYHKEQTVTEISQLTYLKSLHFRFYDDKTFQRPDIFCSDIDTFDIFVGPTPKFDIPSKELSWRVHLKRSIELFECHWPSWEGLTARAEEVLLRQVEVSSICSGHGRAFEDLKRLRIEDCVNMRHLATISQDEIQPLTCFSKLTILHLRRCNKLEYLFCNSIARNLVQLQELSVFSGESMKAVIMNQGTSDREIINFPKLKSLDMSGLGRLESFYADTSGSPTAQYPPLFNGKIAFPVLKKLCIEGYPPNTRIWGQDCYEHTVSSFCELRFLYVSLSNKLEILIPHGMLHRLHNLEHITVYRCHSLRTIFPPSVVIAGGLKHLKELSVQTCEEVIGIIEAGEQVTSDVIQFPDLTDLKLKDLPKLTSLWSCRTGIANTCKVLVKLPQLSSIVLVGLPDLRSIFHGANHEFYMPGLKSLKVSRCGLSTLFKYSTFTNFQLETLEIKDCGLLENIIEDLRGDEACDKIITLSRLRRLEFENLPNLKSFFNGANCEFHMPVIKEVIVRKCGLLDQYPFQVLSSEILNNSDN